MQLETGVKRRKMCVTTKSHVCSWLLICREILKLFISQCEVPRATKIRNAYLCSPQTEKSDLLVCGAKVNKL